MFLEQDSERALQVPLGSCCISPVLAQGKPQLEGSVPTNTDPKGGLGVPILEPCAQGRERLLRGCSAVSTCLRQI